MQIPGSAAGLAHSMTRIRPLKSCARPARSRLIARRRGPIALGAFGEVLDVMQNPNLCQSKPSPPSLPILEDKIPPGERAVWIFRGTQVVGSVAHAEAGRLAPALDPA